MVFFINSVIYIILLLLSIGKLINDNYLYESKEYFKFKIIVDYFILIFIILINILQTIHFFLFFCKKENLNEKRYKTIAKIKKFRGYKISSSFKPIECNFESLKYDDIQFLKKNLFYWISFQQKNIINIINKMREEKIIGKLKYSNNEKLSDFFEKTDHFFLLEILFNLKIQKLIYLFIQ